MKNHIQIGTYQKDGKPAEFNIAKLILTRLLICANSGGGKSWLIRLMAELLFGVMPVIIFDIEGEFVTLRDKFDFILVGPGGETPADCRSAKLVIEKILELRASAVIDLSELSIPERHRYVRIAAEAAMNVPKHLWRPTAFFFDEAHEFCPENGKGSSEAKSAVLAFATKGRKRQFLAVFATQRVHKLALDCRAELLNRMVGMTFEPDDLKTAREILGISGKDETADFNSQMRTMEEGNFYGFGRALCLTTELIKVGMVQTRHGKPEVAATKPPPRPANIEKLLPKLSDLPELAEEKAQNEKEMRETIVDLRRQLKDAKAAAPETKTETKIQKVPFLKPEQAKSIRAIGTGVKRLVKLIEDLPEAIKTEAARLTHFDDIIAMAEQHIVKGLALPSKLAVPITPKIVPSAPAMERPRSYADGPRVHAPGPMSHNGSPDEDLSKGEIAVLSAIAGRGNGITREHISVLTGYKSTSRKEYIRQLKSKGLIEEQGDYIRANEEGVAALGSHYKPLPTGVDLIEHYLRTLSGGEKKIFEFAIAHPEGFENGGELEAATGYKQTSRKEYIRLLRARHVLIEARRGRYVLSETFAATV